jgi:hypothetical protein
MVEATGQVSDTGIIIVFIVAIALVAPIILDVFFAYRQKRSNGDGPAGMQGLYRTLMAVGILLIILVLSIQMLVIFDANMTQITELLTSTNPQEMVSNKVIVGTNYGTNIPPLTTQPHIQSIVTNNNSAQQTTNNPIDTTDTDTLSFWNAVNSVLQLNTLFAGMIRDVVIILAGALSSIIGFYFGSKGAISAAKSATESLDKEGKSGIESKDVGKDEGKGTSGEKVKRDISKQEESKHVEEPPRERDPSVVEKESDPSVVKKESDPSVVKKESDPTGTAQPGNVKPKGDVTKW